MQDWHFGMQVHTSVTFMSQNVQGVTQNTDFTPFSAHLGQKTAQFRPSYPPRLRKHHPQCRHIEEKWALMWGRAKKRAKIRNYFDISAFLRKKLQIRRLVQRRLRGCRLPIQSSSRSGMHVGCSCSVHLLHLSRL